MLTLCILDKFHACVNFFQKNLSGTLPKCKLVLIHIETDILSFLIWVQTVCNGYQEMLLSVDVAIIASKAADQG